MAAEDSQGQEPKCAQRKTELPRISLHKGKSMWNK